MTLFDVVVANPPYSIPSGNNMKYLYTDFFKMANKLATNLVIYVTPTAMVKQIAKQSKGVKNEGLSYVNITAAKHFVDVNSTFAYFVVDKNTTNTTIKFDTTFGSLNVQTEDVDRLLLCDTQERFDFVSTYLTSKRQLHGTTIKEKNFIEGSTYIVFDSIVDGEPFNCRETSMITPKKANSRLVADLGKPKVFFNGMSSAAKHVFLDLEGRHVVSEKALAFYVVFDTQEQATKAYQSVNHPAFATFLQLYKKLGGRGMMHWWEKCNLF